MIILHEKLYISEDALTIDRVRERIGRGEAVSNVYLVGRRASERHFRILRSALLPAGGNPKKRTLSAKYVPTEDILVVGIAQGKEDAVALLAQILEEAAAEKKDLYDYFGVGKEGA